jgi:SAM-dependent methyltransferase
MTVRRRSFALLLLTTVAVATFGFVRLRHRTKGESVPGGILVGDVALYDALIHRRLLRPLFERVAADLAAGTSASERVLDVGCGPGRLSILLARRHGLDVIGLDLDPAMIDRARANADVEALGDARVPTFVVGDVASSPFPDRSFDLVVSTLSMHHWADVAAGLHEIGRVIRPGGRAVIWDLRAGRLPFHPRLPDPVESVAGSSLRVVTARPWRWPWRLPLLRRIELQRFDPVS